MKRAVFFWLEKLRITPAERKAIATLTVMLVVLAICNLALTPSRPFKDERYEELAKQFKERTAQLEAEKEKRMRRYFPPPQEQLELRFVADTVSADTTDEKVEEPKKESPDTSNNRRINVNKADQEILKTLPGIGPAYSKRIIKYRQKHGGFKTVEELKKIKGIGKKRLEKLKPFVKLTGSQ